MNSSLTTQKKAIVITGVIIAFLFYPIAKQFVPDSYSDVNKIVITRLIIWGEVLFLLAFTYFIERRPFLSPQEKYDVNFYLSWVLKLFFLNFLIAFVAAVIKGILGLSENYNVLNHFSATVGRSFILVVFCSLTAGIAEEYICREYIFTRLQLFSKNIHIPVIVSATMFSLLHYGSHSYQQMIGTYIFGVICALHYYKYRNLAVLVLAHIFIDVAVFLWQR